MAHYSPLRYPGGKGKMYNQTLEILQQNNLIGCTYVEAFAGGANLALNLLFNGQVDNIILNYNPFVLNKGIPLFKGNYFENKLKLEKIVKEKDDIVQVHYSVVKE